MDGAAAVVVAGEQQQESEVIAADHARGEMDEHVVIEDADD